jgi:hypothetical protein
MCWLLKSHEGTNVRMLSWREEASKRRELGSGRCLFFFQDEMRLCDEGRHARLDWRPAELMEVVEVVVVVLLRVERA